MRSSLVLVATLAAGPGCSDDAPVADPYQCVAAGGSRCFEVPIDVMYAVDATGTIVDPLLDCGPYEVALSSGPLTIGGLTVDNTEELAVPDVRMEAYADHRFTAPLFDVTSSETGNWMVTVDQMPSLTFTRVSKADHLDLLYLHQRIDIALPVQDMRNVRTVTRDQIAARIATAGDLFVPGTSQLAGVAHDCAGNRLGSVIANASPVTAKLGSRRFEPGVRVYYELENGAALARRPQLHETSGSGGFAITNLPPGPHFIQLWGFPTQADLAIDFDGLRLVAEYEITVFEGESAIVMPLHARL
jgi:hypothetical protein